MTLAIREKLLNVSSEISCIVNSKLAISTQSALQSVFCSFMSTLCSLHILAVLHMVDFAAEFTLFVVVWSFF